MASRRITALGGGTGLSSLLRGLKRRPVDITAVVTVADDGGSSGRLRRELGVLPPGDIRACLVALADDESLMGKLFQHRFADGDLSGHPFGNLFLAALAEVTGDFDTAIEECSHVLKIRGSVLPSTLRHVRLWAEREDGQKVAGETNIAAGVGACRRVWLDPPPPAHAPALEAIMNADLVVLGPGSLFTSVLPHLAVPEIAEALRKTSATRVYVCNVMTQPGETEGMTGSQHVARILDVAPNGVDVAVFHDGPLDETSLREYAAQDQHVVSLDRDAIEALGVRVVTAELAQSEQVVRHDPEALAEVLYALATTSRSDHAEAAGGAG